MNEDVVTFDCRTKSARLNRAQETFFRFGEKCQNARRNQKPIVVRMSVSHPEVSRWRVGSG